jgi:hypothetical protein
MRSVSIAANQSTYPVVGWSGLTRPDHGVLLHSWSFQQSSDSQVGCRICPPPRLHLGNGVHYGGMVHTAEIAPISGRDESVSCLAKCMST